VGVRIAALCIVLKLASRAVPASFTRTGVLAALRGAVTMAAGRGVAARRVRAVLLPTPAGSTLAGVFATLRRAAAVGTAGGAIAAGCALAAESVPA
jgi:hypothetical protein